VALALALAGCAAPREPAAPPAAELSAQRFAAEAARRFDAGEHEQGLALATRALVVRLAHYGVEEPEPALSFVQLGDMRQRLGQPDWARQSYIRALELAAPHEHTHPSIVRLAATRLAALYRQRGDVTTADRLLRRFTDAAP
jgi:Tfp pilus assembly protein PilF